MEGGIRWSKNMFFLQGYTKVGIAFLAIITVASISGYQNYSKKDFEKNNLSKTEIEKSQIIESLWPKDIKQSCTSYTKKIFNKNNAWSKVEYVQAAKVSFSRGKVPEMLPFEVVEIMESALPGQEFYAAKNAFFETIRLNNGMVLVNLKTGNPVQRIVFIDQGNGDILYETCKIKE